jgi:hypothetical protein
MPAALASMTDTEPCLTASSNIPEAYAHAQGCAHSREDWLASPGLTIWRPLHSHACLRAPPPHSLSAAASRFRTFRLPPVSGSSIPVTREFALAACRRRTTFDTTWHYLIPGSTPFCWSGRDCWPPTCATRDESKPRQVPDRRSASHALALAHRTRNIPRCQLHDRIQLASSPCTPSR